MASCSRAASALRLCPAELGKSSVYHGKYLRQAGSIKHGGDVPRGRFAAMKRNFDEQQRSTVSVRSSVIWRASHGRYAERMRSMDASGFLEELFADHPVFVFSKSYCPFSKQAFELLSELRATYEVVELDELPEDFMAAVTQHLQSLTGAAPAPLVYIDGFCTGGFIDTQRLHWDGGLIPALQKAGAMDAGAVAAAAH